MIMIQDVLVSRDIVEAQFVCNLNACKGACCWEGDLGAPLEKAELEILDRIYETIKPILTPEGIAIIEKQGTAVQDKDGDYMTPLIGEMGPCAYMTKDEKGVAQCGIELAYKAAWIDFKKPISCHLYPIRVESNEKLGFEALNYDRWDICSAACSLGKDLKVPVYRFLQEAITRKYGADFYEELEAAATYLGTVKK